MAKYGQIKSFNFKSIDVKVIQKNDKKNKSHSNKFVAKKSQKDDAKIENKITLDEEKDETSKDNDVFKAPNDFQVPATTKNKDEIDQTTMLQ